MSAQITVKKLDKPKRGTGHHQNHYEARYTHELDGKAGYGQTEREAILDLTKQGQQKEKER